VDGKFYLDIVGEVGRDAFEKRKLQRRDGGFGKREIARESRIDNEIQCEIATLRKAERDGQGGRKVGDDARDHAAVFSKTPPSA
jgi:hypothetical protein